MRYAKASPPSFGCGFLLAPPMVAACADEVAADMFRMQGSQSHTSISYRNLSLSTFPFISPCGGTAAVNARLSMFTVLMSVLCSGQPRNHGLSALTWGPSRDLPAPDIPRLWLSPLECLGRQ